MNTSDIDKMLMEEGNLCVSIIIPTHRHSKERMQDPKLLGKAVQKAKDLMQHSAWPKDKVQQLEAKLNTMVAEIDYIRMQEGLAIFISPNLTRFFLLPFEVKEKITIGSNFELRDLIYFSQFLLPYYLIATSKKRIRLFKGQGRELHEINNDDFPREYVEEYEYAPPSIASGSSAGLKNFEGDKSIVRENRQKAFLKQVDHVLDKYLRQGIPLLVAGVEEELAFFEHATHHVRAIVGTIPGNYDHDAVHQLAETAWKKMNEHIHSAHDVALVALREQIGRSMAVDGIRDVWRAAHEGNALTLFVEKDYTDTAYVDPENPSKMYLSPPMGKYDILTDAVEVILETVKAKRGNVVIVPNEVLKDHNRIALLLRYPG